MECLYADEAGASRILERLSSSTRASRRCASALQRGCKTGAGFVRQQQPGKVAKVHAGLAPLRLCVGRTVEDSLTTSGPEDYHASALANHKERCLVGRKGCLLATAGPQLRLQPRTEPSSRNCCNQPFVLGGARPQSIPRPTDSMAFNHTQATLIFVQVLPKLVLGGARPQFLPRRTDKKMAFNQLSPLSRYSRNSSLAKPGPAITRQRTMSQSTWRSTAANTCEGMGSRQR